MDYHAIHGHDISSFEIPGIHRLPTVQASQALSELLDDNSLYISTGLEELDRALVSHDSHRHGGVKRGQITEIWGPPGTGKTAISVQLAANTLCHGQDVVWVDCFHELPISRLEKVLASRRDSPPEGTFKHLSCLTLPHLMALVARPNPQGIPDGVALLIVSNLSSLIASSLPKAVEDGVNAKANKAQSSLIKRRQALQFIVQALQKLAATKNCAAVVLSQCATRMQSEQGATLVAAVNAAVWEEKVSTRLVMFRDWVWQDAKLVSVFLAGLQKLDGKSSNDAVKRAAAFIVNPTGVTGVGYDTTGVPVAPVEAVQHKRKLGQTDLEVPDSEDEDDDYGWADEDENKLPAPPPQWQGSEDILLGQELGQSEGEMDEDQDRSTRAASSEATF